MQVTGDYQLSHVQVIYLTGILCMLIQHEMRPLGQVFDFTAINSPTKNPHRFN